MDTLQSLESQEINRLNICLETNNLGTCTQAPFYARRFGIPFGQIGKLVDNAHFQIIQICIYNGVRHNREGNGFRPTSSTREERRDMTARIIDGKRHATRLRRDVALGVAHLRDETGLVPKLVTILVGQDPASTIYVRRKCEQAVEVGMETRNCELASTTSEAELLKLIASLNEDESVHGILVQLPLPGHIDKARVLLAIAPEKDVDGFHPMNVGLLASDAEPARDRIIPCTPMGIMMMLSSEIGSLEGLHAVVVGCSNIVGRPIAQLLLQARCTVSIAHIHTRDLPELVAQADLLVCAAGAPGLIKGSWIKTGAVVVDVGINRVPANDGRQSRIVGDVCFEEACRRASAITPVPGGVGPMTIACLLENTLRAAKSSRRATGKRDEVEPYETVHADG